MDLDLFILCASYAYFIIHLVCTVVVDGMDNFQVGVLPGPLYTGLVVDKDSYTLCTVNMIAEQNPTVVAGNEIEVACDSAISNQWVIIQSLDTGAEKLCIGEVVIEVFGEYVSMFVLVPQVTLRLTNCSCLFCRIIITHKVRRQCR